MRDLEEANEAPQNSWSWLFSDWPLRTSVRMFFEQLTKNTCIITNSWIKSIVKHQINIRMDSMRKPALKFCQTSICTILSQAPEHSVFIFLVQDVILFNRSYQQLLQHIYINQTVGISEQVTSLSVLLISVEIEKCYSPPSLQFTISKNMLVSESENNAHDWQSTCMCINTTHTDRMSAIIGFLVEVKLKSWSIYIKETAELQTVDIRKRHPNASSSTLSSQSILTAGILLPTLSNFGFFSMPEIHFLILLLGSMYFVFKIFLRCLYNWYHKF